jgi:hypothetical protein
MFQTVSIDEREVAMFRLETRMESIALEAVVAVGAMMWELMKLETSALSRKTFRTSSAMSKLLRVES